ncbi:MAG: hypothetical protein PF495_01490 [Spirochaetales bacterium]|jgi:hypothetical protein|nr:hypothetical protein [Spirochaetales bacterium]
MKKWFIVALAVLAIAGCSTTPEKYTLQALYISLPVTDSDPSTPSFATTQAVSGFRSSDEPMPSLFDSQPSAQNAVSGFHSSDGSILPMSITQPPTQEDIEALLKNPNATIIEFPLVRAGAGETVTNAQTEVYEANVDADIVNGEVIYEKEKIDLGDISTFTVHKILEDGSVSCAFNVAHTRLVGTETYKTDEGIEVKLPYFDSRSVDTQVTLPPNTWFPMGGMIDEVNDGTKITKTHESFYVRVLPPK